MAIIMCYAANRLDRSVAKHNDKMKSGAVVRTGRVGRCVSEKGNSNAINNIPTHVCGRRVGTVHVALANLWTTIWMLRQSYAQYRADQKMLNRGYTTALHGSIYQGGKGRNSTVLTRFISARRFLSIGILSFCRKRAKSGFLVTVFALGNIQTRSICWLR